MHPYVIDQMVEERRQELHRLSRLDRARPRAWRMSASRALVALAVHLGGPPPERPAEGYPSSRWARPGANAGRQTAT